MKRSFYLNFIILFICIFLVHNNVNSVSADDSQIQPIPKSVEKTKVEGSKTKTLCQSNRTMKKTPPPQEGNTDTQRPKNCRCLGRRSDGPLEGLCVIPCSCPGNCNKSD